MCHYCNLWDESGDFIVMITESLYIQNYRCQYIDNPCMFES